MRHRRMWMLLVPLPTLASCSWPNLIDDGHGLCRSTMQELPESLYPELERELRKEPPNGYLTKPYSEEVWDEYWNSRYFYMYDVGPESCGGTYRGHDGPYIVTWVMNERRKLGMAGTCTFATSHPVGPS